MADQTGPQLTMTLASDHKTMNLVIADQGKVRAGIVLSAEQLDQIIAGLVRLRGEMKPEVPTEFPERAPPPLLRGTHYHFALEAQSGRLTFSLRNPGLGWLSFRFDGPILERMLGLARAAHSRPRAPISGAKH